MRAILSIICFFAAAAFVIAGANAQNCVAIRQLVEPGEPMKRLEN